MTKKSNPHIGEHPDLFEGYRVPGVKKKTFYRDTPIYVPLSELTHEQIIALPVRAFNSTEWWEITKEQRRAVASNQTMTLEEMVDEELWDWLGHAEQELFLQHVSLEEAKSNPRIWEEVLDDEQREALVENDPDAQKRIEEVVEYFVDAYESAMEPDEDYILQSFKDNDYLSQWLNEKADELVDYAREHGHGDEIDSIVAEHAEAGYTEEQVERAIDEAMRETDVYDASVGDEYNRAFFKDMVSHGSLYVDVEGVYKTTSQMSEIELKLAIDQINSATDDVYQSRWGSDRGMTPATLQKKNHYFERDFEAYAYVDCEPNWSQISAAVEKILEDVEPEGDEVADDSTSGAERPKEPPLEDRIVYKWKDGFFVLELTPKEMVAEGAPYLCPEHGPFYPPGELFASKKTWPCPRCSVESPYSDESLHMCIGSTSQPFLRAVRKGTGKAWSLRTPSGKKKIAIFADLGRDGNIRRIDQARGFGNRFPGFEASKRGGSGLEGKFKMDEVAKVAEFISSLGPTIDPGYVNDLTFGLKKIAQKAIVENNQEAKKLVDKLAKMSPRFGDIYDDVKEEFDRTARREDLEEPPRENPDDDDGPCPHCGGARGGFCGT